MALPPRPPSPSLLLRLLLLPCAARAAARLPPAECAASAFAGPVSCSACAGADAGVNVVETLPRVSRLGIANANLGFYSQSLLSCPVAASNASTAAAARAGGICAFASPAEISAALAPLFTAGAPPASASALQNYVESSPLLYGALGVLLALTAALCGCCFCLCRNCCCCCGRWCPGGCCGATHPTLARSARCSLGFSKRLGAYPPHSRAATACFLAAAIAAVAALIGFGHVYGSLALTVALKDVADAPAGFVATLRGVRAPVAGVIIAVAADAVMPMLVFVRGALTGGGGGGGGGGNCP